MRPNTLTVSLLLLVDPTNAIFGMGGAGRSRKHQGSNKFWEGDDTDMAATLGIDTSPKVEHEYYDYEYYGEFTWMW